MNKRTITLIFILFTVISISLAQKIIYDGGYFLHTGNSNWEEWRPQDKSTIWAAYSQYGEDTDFYYVYNSHCNLAIPKANTSNDVHISHDNGASWSKIYNRTSNSQTYGSSIAGSSKVSCFSCGGSKVCSTCNGSLYVTMNGLYFTQNTYTLPCPTCHQTGVCGICNGRGWTVIDEGGYSNHSGHSGNHQNNSHNSLGSCRKCHGKRICTTCNGDGVVFSTTYAVNKYIKCPACNGSKVCSLCNGRGS